MNHTLDGQSFYSTTTSATVSDLEEPQGNTMTRTQESFSPANFTKITTAHDMTPQPTASYNYGAIGSGRMNKNTVKENHYRSHEHLIHNQNKIHRHPATAAVMLQGYHPTYSTASTSHANPNIPFSLFAPQTNGRISHQQTGYNNGQFSGQNNGQINGQSRLTPPTRPPPGFSSLQRTNSQGFIAPETIDGMTDDMIRMDVTSATTLPTTNTIGSTIWSTAGAAITSGSEFTHPAAGQDVDSDSDDDTSDQTHPNKYPVEIEEHYSKACGYRRQGTRSGPKIKHRNVTVYDPITLEPKNEPQQIKYYQKDIVRTCRCGRYPQMDGALTHGRSNDCDGYEIHYNQKCKWKAYDDFKTGKRVLIRLCKCYKPSL